MDLDGDGALSMFELEYFYEEQCRRLDSMAIEALPFEDCLCQMLDLVKPRDEGNGRSGRRLVRRPLPLGQAGPAPWWRRGGALGRLVQRPGVLSPETAPGAAPGPSAPSSAGRSLRSDTAQGACHFLLSPPPSRTGSCPAGQAHVPSPGQESACP